MSLYFKKSVTKYTSISAKYVLLELFLFLILEVQTTNKCITQAANYFYSGKHITTFFIFYFQFLVIKKN
jgi:hypothetical protein